MTRASTTPLQICARSALAAALASATPVAAAPLQPDPPIECRDCAAWNEPLEPFRIHGSTYYVGTAGLAAIMVSTEDGLVLLDGALPQSAARIEESIRKLGFRTEDIRLIVSSHAHYDHAGGIAALQRASGAVVAVSAPSAIAFRGEPATDDPQFTLGSTRFPPVSNLRIIGDRETQRVGGTAFTPHFTPGHTPGSTTWTWQSCEDAVCVNIVYADSLNAVSADEFRFTGDAARPKHCRRVPDEHLDRREFEMRHPTLAAPGIFWPRGQARAAPGGRTESVHRRGRVSEVRGGRGRAARAAHRRRGIARSRVRRAGAHGATRRSGKRL